MKICVLGLGYIGLPSSITFAKYDHDVVGIDINDSVVESLNNNRIHINEEGLQEELVFVKNNKKIRFAHMPEESDVFIIAVPTPNKKDGLNSCDLSYVESAVLSIVPYLQKGNTVIIESTMAPGSTDNNIKPLIEAKGFVVGEDIFLVHCPERVLPGNIMHEMIYNNRIIGGVTVQCTEAGAKVYGSFVKGEILRTNAKTAEMSKLLENTFRDVNIALANEVSKICNEHSINTYEAINLANKHPRVNYLQPGPGVGGHCIAVDPYFITSVSPENARLIKLAREINKSMPDFIIENLKKILGDFSERKIAIFGLTYKGNVDDIRESPAMEIYKKLQKYKGLEIVAYDPFVDREFVEKDIEITLRDTDLILVLSDHDCFKDISVDKTNLMRNKVIFDTKNVVKSFSDGTTLINLGNVYDFNNSQYITLN